MVAIQSTQPVEDGEGNEIECGTEPNNTAVIAQGVPFIEDNPGVDITPCFDQDGNWDPNFDCQGFPVDPAAGGGSWAVECEAGPLTGWVNSCGATFPEEVPDSEAPSVVLVEPEQDAVLSFEGDAVTVHVLADANDGDGWGMDYVQLVIMNADAMDVLATFDDLEEAYEWDPEFPSGVFIIQAIGYDNAGLKTETETRTIYVGVDPPGAGDDDAGDGEDETGGGDDDGGDAGGTGGDAGGTAGDDDDDAGGDGTGLSGGLARGNDDDGGCSCRTGTSGPGALGLLILGLVAIRRRPVL